MLTEPIVIINHFTVYVDQTIMLYALNLHSDICQLFLNKIGKERFEKILNLNELNR